MTAFNLVSLEECLTSLCFPSAVHYLRIRNINIVENRRDEVYSARKTPQTSLNFFLTIVRVAMRVHTFGTSFMYKVCSFLFVTMLTVSC